MQDLREEISDLQPVRDVRLTQGLVERLVPGGCLSPTSAASAVVGTGAGSGGKSRT